MVKQQSLIIGLGSIVVGGLASAYFPNPFMVYGMYTLGIGVIAGHYILPKNNFKILFENCGLHKGEMFPQLQEKKETSYGYCLRYSIPLGLSTDDFKKHQKAIEDYLGKKVEIKYAHKNVLIEVYERLLEKEYLYEPINTKGVLEVPIGRNIKGIETIDFAKGPHTLLAGESGAGKSTALRAIVTYLIDYKKVKLHLIDLKIVEFAIFRKSSRVETYAKSVNEAIRIIKKLVTETNRRYELFYQNDCVDIKEYNKKSKVKLPYEMLIIDEFADLADTDAIEDLIELLRKSRAAGIHCLIATQRPCAKTLDTRIKSNIPYIIGLKTMNATNSQIVIDQAGLEKLRGEGHALLKTDDMKEIQCFNISTQQARDIVRPTYRQEVASFEPKQDITKVLEVLDGGKRKAKKAR